ncbi:hypothetical protein RB195_020134 [Necator americanus]|uniref:Uncharacterized protein n=1 Tax=Necator americanus TaxID=51031 RepID=A0ABR1CHD7_NECAM
MYFSHRPNKQNSATVSLAIQRSVSWPRKSLERVSERILLFLLPFHSTTQNQEHVGDFGVIIDEWQTISFCVLISYEWS